VKCVVENDECEERTFEGRGANKSLINPPEYKEERRRTHTTSHKK
jgi:hypothetical protein